MHWEEIDQNVKWLSLGGVEIMVIFYLWFNVFPLACEEYVLAVKLERK